MDMIHLPEHKEVISMLQTADPEEYKFQSNEIVAVLESLHKDFKKQKADLDADFAKTKQACKKMVKAIGNEMGSNKDSMKKIGKNIQKLSKEKAEVRQQLVEDEDDLKDDERFLKDVTSRCEAAAKNFDQRSSMRASEVSTL